MKIGYLRVSTKDQCEDRQIDALIDICDELRIEKRSACAKKRPVFQRLISELQAGDIFLIWSLDRAFRSAKDALNQLDALRERGIEIQIASFQLDTATPYGKFMYTMISGLAEFERDLLSERTKQGMAAAKKRGKRIGRPRKMTRRQIKDASLRLTKGTESLNAIAADYGVAGWTLARSIRREGIEIQR